MSKHIDKGKLNRAAKSRADQDSDLDSTKVAGSLSLQQLNHTDRERLRWILGHERFVDCDQSYESVTLAWLEAVDTRTMSRVSREKTHHTVRLLKMGQIYYAIPFRRSAAKAKPPLAFEAMSRPLKPPPSRSAREE